MTKGRGVKSKECRMPEKKKTHQKIYINITVARWGRRGCCWWHCERAPRHWAAGLRAGGSRLSAGLTWRDPAGDAAGGAAHARPQRGAARGSISRWSSRAAAGGALEMPPPAAPANPAAAGEAGSPPCPSRLQSPPRLLLLQLLSSLASPRTLPPAELNSPALAASASARERAGTHRPGVLGRGRGPGRRRAPLPGRGAVLKLRISWAVLAPWRPHQHAPPSPGSQNPFARAPSLGLLSSPLTQRWYRLPELRPPGIHNQASDNQVCRLVLTASDGAEPPGQRGLRTPLLQMFSRCN